MINRLKNELCVGCGNPLIFPFNEYRTCRNCTEKIKKVLYETKMRRINKDTRKGVLNIKHTKILTPLGPLGRDA